MIVAPQKVLAANITEIGYESSFATFRAKTPKDPYGILIYASGETIFFPTEEKLAEFVKRNYDTPLPKLVNLEIFYRLMWQALDHLRQTDPQKLFY